MLIIGLTGSIATGKSTVSKLLSSPPHNLEIIDADKIAREVVEPGTSGYRAIVAHFGPTTPDLLEAPTPENGGEHGPKHLGRPLNRAALGRRVFGPANTADRKVLNGIVHPRVGLVLYTRIVSAYLLGSWGVVLDIPLLYETGWETLCGVVIVVGITDPRTQMDRLMLRDGHLSEEDARNRVQSQYDVRVKCARATERGQSWGYTLWNDKDTKALERDVEAVVASMHRASPRWWTVLLWVNPLLMACVAGWTYLLARRKKSLWEKANGTGEPKLKVKGKHDQ